MVSGDWTPPLFQEGRCPNPPGEKDQDDSTSTDDDASASTSTLEEFASPREERPDVLEQTAEGLSSDDNATIMTICSG